MFLVELIASSFLDPSRGDLNAAVSVFLFNPKLRLFFVRNWVLLYISENANRCAQLSRSSYYRFTFLRLSFRYLVQNKQIVKVL